MGDLIIYGLVAVIAAAGVVWVKSAKPDHAKRDDTQATTGQQETYSHISMAEEEAWQRAHGVCIADRSNMLTAGAAERSERGRAWQQTENLRHLENLPALPVEGEAARIIQRERDVARYITEVTK